MARSVSPTHVARVLITEARARRLSNGYGFWCFFHMAQSARRRAAEAPPAPAAPERTPPTAPAVPAGTQQELFA